MLNQRKNEEYIYLNTSICSPKIGIIETNLTFNQKIKIPHKSKLDEK